MLTPKMEKALLGQLNAELYSAYLYLAMAAYLRTRGMAGAAHWMRTQVQEEMAHALKFADYAAAAGGRLELAPVAAPAGGWDSPRAVFEAALAHEKKVTALIADLVATARAEGDAPTGAFLAWFVGEQAEEEESVEKVLAKFDNLDVPTVDAELATRVFHPPAIP